MGFITGLCFLIATLYGLTDLDALFETAFAFPLGEIYRQDTGTGAGGIGLLFLVLAPTVIACLGCYLTASRVRDVLQNAMLAMSNLDADLLDTCT